MNTTFLVPSVALVISGLLLIIVANRTADGRIGPNRWAGIRTRASKASPEAWRSTHEAARPSTVKAGRAFLLAGLVAPVPRVGVFLVVIGIAAGFVWLYLGTRAGVRAVTPIARDQQ